MLQNTLSGEISIIESLLNITNLSEALKYKLGESFEDSLIMLSGIYQWYDNAMTIYP